MNVLLTGSAGMLAQAFLNKRPRDWHLDTMDIDTLDMTHRDAVQKTISDLKPVLIINCAAFTQVDDCELEVEHAYAVNSAAVGYLAEAARVVGAKLVHFSTDYIFDGQASAPYDETHAPAPLNVYGASKLQGENQVRRYTTDHLILRTQWLYGQGKRHFVQTILDAARKKPQLTVVDDQVGSPTWTEDLSEAALALIDCGAVGTYHVVNTGICSWYAFACEIIKEAGLTTSVVPCKTAFYPRPARRPAYGVLSTQKMQATLGRALPAWDLALRRFLRST